MDLLKVCIPLLMVFILQFFLCMDEPQWLMINLDDCPLTENVISPLAVGFHNGVHLFFISSVLMDDI
jgi:hypothetical protein